MKGEGAQRESGVDCEQSSQISVCLDAQRLQLTWVKSEVTGALGLPVSDSRLRPYDEASR